MSEATMKEGIGYQGPWLAKKGNKVFGKVEPFWEAKPQKGHGQTIQNENQDIDNNELFSNVQSRESILQSTVCHVNPNGFG